MGETGSLWQQEKNLTTLSISATTWLPRKGTSQIKAVLQASMDWPLALKGRSEWQWLEISFCKGCGCQWFIWAECPGRFVACREANSGCFYWNFSGLWNRYLLFIHVNSNTVKGDLEEVKSYYIVLVAKMMGRIAQEVLIQSLVKSGCILKVIHCLCWYFYHAPVFEEKQLLTRYRAWLTKKGKNTFPSNLLNLWEKF